MNAGNVRFGRFAVRPEARLPGATIDERCTRIPVREAADRQHLAEWLHAAGFPE